MTPVIQRLLPASPDAEKAILSGLVISPVAVAQVIHGEGLTSHHFHVPAHAEIFENITVMIGGGEPVDFVTLTKKLQGRGKLEAVGGVSFVSELFTFLATAVNVSFYVDIVKRDHLAREVIRLGTKYAGEAYDCGEGIKTLAAAFQGDLSALLVERKTRQSVRDCLVEIIRELQTGEADGEILQTGIPEIDSKLALYKGDLLIISAPTSCGKSALANQMLITAACERGARVAFYPLEMRQKQTLTRALAVRSGVNVKYLRSLLVNANTPGAEKFAGDMLTKLTGAVKDIVEANMHIRDDLHGLDAIIADIRAEHSKAPFQFIAVDYLQLIRVHGKFERRQLQIAEITQRFKMLANELDCVVIIPSQQNKSGGTREGEDAENDASALIKIHENEEKEDPEPGRIEVWKQREGPRHVDLALKFNPLLTKFEPETK